MTRTLTGLGPHNEPRVAVFSDDEAMMYRYSLEIAANVCMIEQHTAMTEGNRSMPATQGLIDGIVEKIKAGGNY